MIPADGWWAASWWLGHPELELHATINTPVVRSGPVMSYIDLDLDVVRWLVGAGEIVDQVEFELHRVELRYPDAVVQRA